MSMPEIHLRAAAGAIDQMSATDIQQALRKLKQKRGARSQMDILHQQTELASLELDQAAYQLASEAEAQGDLARAAHWYTAAALNDVSDASLKLAKILDALAEKHLADQGGNPATREELDLVSEACRWYSDALVAGETEAQELLEKLIERHLGKSRKNVPCPQSVKSAVRPGGDEPQLPASSDRTTEGPGRQGNAGVRDSCIPSIRGR
jgi:hypothetical protein